MGHQEDIAKTESKIIVIRDIQVILDRDVAELYGVETKAINQAVKRNIEKFPPEYMFQLSKEEKQEVVTKCDHLGNLRYSRTLPNAFTEQGLYMLATILKSPIATETTFAIIDTFTKLRKLARTMAKLNAQKQCKIFTLGGSLIPSFCQTRPINSETEDFVRQAVDGLGERDSPSRLPLEPPYFFFDMASEILPLM